MDTSAFIPAVIVSLILLYGIREIRNSLVKISADIQDFKKTLQDAASKSQD